MVSRIWTVFAYILVLASVLTTGCARYQPAPSAFHEIIQKPYALDTGDRLRITVFEQADLTNTYTVDKAGYIAFPLVGSVPARGRTIKEIEASLARQLAADYLRDPDVSVEVDTYRPFYIMGEVNSPGQYTYVPGMTIQNAIAVAGGYSARAHQPNADVTRHINGEILTGRIVITDPIMPGDTIYLRERLF